MIENENRKSDTSWKLLGCAIFFSPLRCYGLFTIGTFTGSLFKLFMVAAIFACTINLFRRQYFIYKNGTALFITLLILMDLISLLYSSGMGLFPTYFVAHIELLFGFIIIENHRGKIVNLMKIYIASAVIPGCLGLYQWISVMRYGKVPALPFQQFLVTAGKDDIFLYGNYRVVGTLQDPSYYGLYMATVFVICFGMIISRNKGLILTKFERITTVAVCVLSGVSVFISGSVTSIAALACGVLFFIFTGKFNVIQFIKYMFAGILLLGLAFLILKNVFDYDAINVLTEKLLIQGNSSSVGAAYGRGDFFQAAIDDFWKSPIWGVGFGNMTNSSGHNSFLTILALQGIIGLILNCMVLIYYPFIYYRSAFRCTTLQGLEFQIRLAALFGMLCLCVGYDCLYKMDPTVVVLLLTLGLDCEEGIDE